VPGVIPSGNAYQITCDGVNPKVGQIYQSVSEWLTGDPWSQAFATASGDNGELVPIIQPNVGYSVRAKIKQSGMAAQGTVRVGFWSPSQGFFAGQGIAVNAALIGTSFEETIAELIPANTAIPADAVFQVCADNTSGGTPGPDGATFQIDDIEIFSTLAPYNVGVVRGSLAANPESFDGTTGLIEPDEEDGLDIRSMFGIRDNLYMVKEEGGKISVTDDDGVNEPADWEVDTVADSEGTPSVNGVATANNWALIFNRNGLYIFDGRSPTRISEEIQPTWDSVNWEYGFAGWVTINVKERYALIGLPFGEATSPSETLFFSYRELDSAGAIAENPPPHVTMFGTTKILPKCRKWCPWTATGAAAAMIERPDGIAYPWLGTYAGGGALGQITPGQRTDGGLAIDSFYWTHFMPDAIEQLQSLVQRLQKESNRWQMRHLTAEAEGAGKILFTAAGPASVVLVAFTGKTLASPPVRNIQLPCSVTAEQIQIQIATDGEAGSWFHVGKLTPWLKAAPWAQIGAGS
jgi:hypothetical protein